MHIFYIIIFSYIIYSIFQIKKLIIYGCKFLAQLNLESHTNRKYEDYLIKIWNM